MTQLDQLRSDLEWARSMLLEAQAEATREATRADQAEATLARIRALHSPCSYPNPDGPGDITYCTGCDASTVAHPCNTLAALDESRELTP